MSSGAGEASPALRDRLLCGYFFLLFCAMTVANVVAYTVFVKRAGVAWLPWYYVALNALAFALQWRLLSGARFSNERGHVTLLVAYALFLLLFSRAPDAFGVPGYMLLMVATQLFVIFGYVTWFGFLAERLTLLESKELVPRVYAWGSAGAIVSGYLVKYLFLFLGSADLMLLLSASLLPLLLLYGRVRSLGGGAPESPAAAPHADSAGPVGALADLFAYARRTPLVALLCAVSALISFQEYMIDYQFFARLSAEFPDERAMASYSGVFRSGLMFFITALQFFALGPVLRRLSISGGLAVMPAAMVAALALPFLSLSLFTVSSVKFAFETTLKVFNRPCIGILVNATGERRARMNLFFELFTALGKFAAGAFLILLAPRLSPGACFALIGVLFALYGLLALRLDRAYVGILRDNLARTDDAVAGDALEELGYVPYRRLEESVERLLSSDRPEERRRAALALAAFEGSGARLERLLDAERDPRVLSTAVACLADRDPARFVARFERFLDHPDDRVRATVLEGVGRLRDRALRRACLEGAERFLAHAHHRVRSGAILATLHAACGDEPGRLGAALRGLRDLLDSRETLQRSAGIASAGEIGLPAFSGDVAARLDDSDPAVRRVAVRTLPRFRGGECARALARAREREPLPDLRAAIDEALERLAEDSRAALSGLLDALPEEERQAATLLAREGDADRRLLLERALRAEPSVRRAVFRLAPHAGREEAPLLSACLVDAGEAVRPSARPLYAEAEADFFAPTPLVYDALEAFGPEVAADGLDAHLDLVDDRIREARRRGAGETPPGAVSLDALVAHAARVIAASAGRGESTVRLIERLAEAGGQAGAYALELLEKELPPRIRAAARPFLASLPPRKETPT